MSIRISHIRKDGKQQQGTKQVDVARAVEVFLKDKGIDAKVTISYRYADKWWDIDAYESEVLEVASSAKERRETYCGRCQGDGKLYYYGSGYREEECPRCKGTGKRVY